MTCPRCAMLEERVAYLEGELGQARDATVLAWLSERFGLRPGEALMLENLWRARGRVLSRYQLADAIGSQDDTAGVVDVYVHRLRKKVGRGAILTLWGRGFRIGPEGARVIEEARAHAYGEGSPA